MLHVYASRSGSALLKTLTACVLLLGLAVTAHAQDVEVEGTVVSTADQQPLPGVNVREVGTNQGTTTNPSGEFSLQVSDPQATLRFSFVGFRQKEVNLNGRTQIRVTLEEKVEDLEGVVVTAYGQEQEQRSLGYSVEEVQGGELAETRTNNLGEALQGKLAGVNIQAPPTGPGGSTRITIRGNTNLSGNDPLFVVDGVPIRNVQEGNASKWGGTDGGDALSTINPENIESLSVLKGASAAALYGSRAQNGVVIIETKGGGITDQETFSAEYSGSVKSEWLKSTFDEFQYQYGQGTRGEAPSSQQEALETALSSWGAPVGEVDQAVQFDGEMRPYEAHRDNLQDFYDVGIRSEHSVAVTRSGSGYNVRVSMSRMDDGYVIPASDVGRTTMNLRGAGDVGNLHVDGKLNYSIQESDFRPELSDNPGNPMLSLTYMPTTLDVSRLRPAVDEEGNHRAWSTSVFRPNPYFGQSQLERNDQRRQVRGFATARYSFTEGISLQARVGTDWYTLDATRATPSGTPWNTDGGISESTTRRREDNFDALFQFDQNLTESLTLDATLGGNVRYTTSENVSASGSDFILPNLVTLGNTRGDKQGGGYNFSEQQVNSLFGTAQFGYNNSLFVEVTGRNDWSSTLPADNNSYFYPSVSSSFIFSDVFDLPDVISFGKLRASAGRVGGDTGPYQLDVTYGLIGSHPSRTGGTVSRGALQQGTIPPLNLKPQEKETIEVGTNLQFFDDRLGLDVTWYRENSFNQILNVSISNTTGFGSRRINAGNIRNQGLELQLRGAILQSSAYSWRSRMNFSRNVNEVVELAENIESFGLGSSRSQRTSIQARVGEPYGQIVGPSFKRTEDGEIIHNPDGLPVVGDNEPLGNQEPSWTAGFTNTFRWQNLTLEALIDVSWGADLYSFTNAQAYGTGRHEDTLPGRDAGSVIGNGVKQATDENGNVVEGEYVENDVKVDPQDYYGFIAGNLDEPFVYDASYVRLRSLRLGYTLPGSLLEALPGLSSARVSVIGRNLWLIHDEVPNVDPSGGYSTGTDHGLEHASLPATRTFGVDVNLRF